MVKSEITSIHLSAQNNCLRLLRWAISKFSQMQLVTRRQESLRITVIKTKRRRVPEFIEHKPTLKFRRTFVRPYKLFVSILLLSFTEQCSCVFFFVHSVGQNYKSHLGKNALSNDIHWSRNVVIFSSKYKIQLSLCEHLQPSCAACIYLAGKDNRLPLQLLLAFVGLAGTRDDEKDGANMSSFLLQARARQTADLVHVLVHLSDKLPTLMTDSNTEHRSTVGYALQQSA